MRLIRQKKHIIVPVIGLILLSVSIGDLTSNHVKDVDSIFNPKAKTNTSLRVGSIQEIESNTVFLPRTNLSVQEYIDGFPGNTFNTTILGINKSHWDVRCDYSIPNGVGDPEYESPFYPSVNRSSISHFYNASPYFMWWGYKQDIFDFWIDPSGFYDGYILEIDGLTYTVTEELFTLEIDQFDAWKLSSSEATSRYSKEGMFLSLNYTFVSQFWYNLSLAELAPLPLDYEGPTIKSVTPGNNTVRPNGTTIQIELQSPFVVDEVEYNWDNGGNTSSTSLLTTTFPIGETSHLLTIFASDTLSITNIIHLIFITDDTYPAIELVGVENNSKIRGNTNISLSIKSGNGTFTYKWDTGGSYTVPEGTQISTPPEEGLHWLNVSVQSLSLVEASAVFTFTIDNTPPVIEINRFENNSVIKGDVEIQISSNEKVQLKSFLVEINDSREFIIDVDVNKTLRYSKLENGTYTLYLNATDEAQNSQELIYYFSIYTSAFNWNWELKAFIPRTISFNDHLGNPWFYLTITSQVDQQINLTLVSEEGLPQAPANFSYAVKFDCEQPDEVIFLTLALPINGTVNNFPVHQWYYWNESQINWVEMGTYFNEVDFVWEATYDGYIPYFALIDTGKTSQTKEVVTGGGQIPSFEIPLVLITLFCLTLFETKKRKFVSKTYR